MYGKRRRQLVSKQMSYKMMGSESEVAELKEQIKSAETFEDKVKDSVKRVKPSPKRLWWILIGAACIMAFLGWLLHS